ncbi:hypothetical protein PAHAL_7G321500 [Panicum hallii]|uniref:Uncharacterized protein n=1 Tax=Panicum hallii TaxID=206008 RepID=A0A2S3IB47_9POAL|nr:hypothetical protein PAHAL_7G321500 [Panicum hallii]
MSSRVMKAAACGGDQRGLDGELEEKLLLRDGGLTRCSAGAAALLQKRGMIERRRLPPVLAGQGGAGDAGDYHERFVRAYDRLRDELLADDSCELTDEARRWVEQMIDYNVPGGKLNRGLSVIDSYLLLKQGSEITEDEFFLACVLGWCVEWFQACALLLDDIMDGSHTRRDQICWYRRPEVGLWGINDGILLKCHIARLIKRYFREKTYYIDISELWNEVALQTSLGQMLDLISTHNGADELAKYNIEGYRRIVKYKTSYYSFYLPVACALLLSGAKLENFSELRDILIEMGVYFQAQDDYLDCFADPNTIGKIGTDIEDHKCSWLIVQALGHANINQIEVLLKNYGKKDSTSVSKVKSTYSTLDLKDMFSEFEDRAYKHLVTSIEAQRDRAVQEILKSFLKKIHRRKK